MSATLTLAQVFQHFLPAYRRHHRCSPEQASAVQCILNCRTQVLGADRLCCAHCGFEQQVYRACRNRHCPHCQQQATAQWLNRRSDDLLPVAYHHLVFTLPHTLNDWVSCCPRLIYRLLFDSAWQALRQLGRDPKRLGGELGMSAVLHTWGENLSRHVHLHCLVPGGALATTPSGDAWHGAPRHYLFPVRALSRGFRGRMVAGLRRAVQSGELAVNDEVVSDRLDSLMSHDWVVYSRPVEQRAPSVLRYLARYTHRIAISESRLHGMDQEHVYFTAKDYASDAQRRILRLRGEEFMRRFLLHILPRGFMRVRHYGFLANCHRRRQLARIRACLADEAPPPASALHGSSLDSQSWQVGCCPSCGQGPWGLASNALQPLPGQQVTAAI